MSKNIIIQEGGIGKQLTVDKLKTNLVGSGTCLWVPEDEVQLGTKTITENGTYKASNDGYYGYEQVVVNVANVGTVTGTDGDGDEAVAYTDPTTGELVIDKVPSRIEVVTPPTNPYGIYTNGQTISTNGMVVKAYLASGSEYGTVPLGEITINPTTAVYDRTTDRVDIITPEEATSGDVTVTGGVSADTLIRNIISDFHYNRQNLGEHDTAYAAAPVYVGDASLLSGIGFMGSYSRAVDITGGYGGGVGGIYAFDESVVGKTISIGSRQPVVCRADVDVIEIRERNGAGGYDYTLTFTIQILSETAINVSYIGTQYWNQGRTQEIKERVLHL